MEYCSLLGWLYDSVGVAAPFFTIPAISGTCGYDSLPDTGTVQYSSSDHYVSLVSATCWVNGERLICRV